MYLNPAGKTSPAPVFSFCQEIGRVSVKSRPPTCRYRWYMKLILLTAGAIFLLSGVLLAGQPGYTLDSNSAFYEGESLNYVMSPPDGFRLVTYKAKFDGYSLAFIPDDEIYDSASVIIGVHIYKIRGMSFNEALVEDTNSIRGYYGKNLIINPIESLTNASHQKLTSFYLDNKQQFIPNVMISYFDGGSEMIIFELVIRDDVTRFKTEEPFVQCVQRFRSLKKGELSAR